MHCHTRLRIYGFIFFMCFPWIAVSGLLNSLEKALMPGQLAQVHAEYENDCKHCHRVFSKTLQTELCIQCHDHKNIAEDMQKKQGLHGRIDSSNIETCRSCHKEHVGRDAQLIQLDKLTFDHKKTDYSLKGKHTELVCEACHLSKDKYYAAKHLCVDCHENTDVHKGALGSQCNRCHSEMGWSSSRFDHSGTKFALTGQHEHVKCQRCHVDGKFTAIPSRCVDCHKFDDVHKSQYGNKCQKCHSNIGWKSAKFDHNKETDFKLSGKHKLLECKQCHKPNRKANESKKTKTCFSCHELSDKHKGRFGKKCKDCHNTQSWRKKKFDHQKTDFPLNGKHKEAKCVACHMGNVVDQQIESECFACHRQNDPHHETQYRNCNHCHDEVNWLENIIFDHQLVRFPLLGAHEALSCDECHLSNEFTAAPTDCYSCHKDQNVHEQRLGLKCIYCHYMGDWKAWEFSHDTQTEYKLEGAHAELACKLCHTQNLEDTVELIYQCKTCHLKDDVHDGAFGNDCQRCHNQNRFDEINFTF